MTSLIDFLCIASIVYGARAMTESTARKLQAWCLVGAVVASTIRWLA